MKIAHVGAAAGVVVAVSTIYGMSWALCVQGGLRSTVNVSRDVSQFAQNTQFLMEMCFSMVLRSRSTLLFAGAATAMGAGLGALTAKVVEAVSSQLKNT